MGFKIRQRKAARSSLPGRALIEGYENHSDRRSLSMAKASIHEESVDTTTPPSTTEIWLAPLSQNERATKLSSPADACQCKYLHASDRMVYLSQMAEQKTRADSRPTQGSLDKDTAPLESGGSSRATVKRFMKEKGPRIARAAVTIGVLVFNVVTFC